MNKFLIAAYATLAIFASGFAKADSTNQAGIIAEGLDASFNQATFELMVSGISPTDCSGRVVMVEQDQQILKFSIINTIPMDSICTQRISKFMKTVPVRPMVHLAKIEINPELEYTLTVSGSPLTVKVFGSELLSY